jgi:hypothetical protein
VLAGIEADAGPATLSFYYSQANFEPNAFPDTTSALVAKPTIGFGGTNAANSANTVIREITGGLRQTMWSQPKLGALQLLVQVSRLTRQPGFVAIGQPARAQTTMIFGSLRYVLP